MKQIIKIGDVSNGLKPYFFDEIIDKENNNKKKYQISIVKIRTIFKNVNQIQFLHYYNNDMTAFLYNFITLKEDLKKKNVIACCNLKKVLFTSFIPENDKEKHLFIDIERTLPKATEAPFWHIPFVYMYGFHVIYKI